MYGVHFINLEYVFLRIYELFTGISVDTSQVPSQAVALGTEIAVVGMGVSLFLLIMIVYVRIRTLEVEHHGFHVKEEHEHAHFRSQAHRAEPKNPRWDAVLALAASPNESDWRRAIMEADIMLSALLVERGYQGATVADQLKQGNPLQFTTLDLAWEAHRMRNALAHLGEAFPLSERDARATIDLYRRVFEEFNYI